VNTAERYAEPVQPVSALPATSTALVPVVRGRPPRIEVSPGAERPVNAHRLFFGMGYFGLVMVWTAVWLSGFVGHRAEFITVIGGMFIGLGGFGILIHTLWKPNERKVRHLLLALGSLGLTLAAIPPVHRISREMYAAAAVDRLQPLAEELARDERIRIVGVFNGELTLNGYVGPSHGPGLIHGAPTAEGLAGVLASGGISRGEFDAYFSRLQAAGMNTAEHTAAGVVFHPSGPYDLALLYLAPGRALPPAHALLGDPGQWHSEPLGGAWHMVVRGRR
jgi:hypothetical protein